MCKYLKALSTFGVLVTVLYVLLEKETNVVFSN